MDSFIQRKKAVLEKDDKSAKGIWDERIVSLCEAINSFENYYTTSSCSGKSVIIEDKIGKDGTYYPWESHEMISLDEIKLEVSKLKKEGNFKFKTDSPIIFVVCRDAEFAKKLFSFSVLAGFKESGIKLTNKLIGVEIKSGERIEFPIFSDGKLLVGDLFLERIVEVSNKKRKLGWEKIEKLYSLLKKL